MILRKRLGLLGLCTAALFAASAAGAGQGPEIESWETDNGVRVLFAASEAVPMVDIRLVFDAGSAREEANHGIARLTNRLMSAGTDELDEEALARRFESLGAEFDTSSGREQAAVSLRSLTDPDHLDPAAELMADVMAAPSFPEGALERERRRMQVAIQREDQSPGDTAIRAFLNAVYGDHPYGNHPAGTEAGLEGITRDDVAAFHEAHYTTGNAFVAIVGDLDRDGAEALANRITERLPAGEALPPLPAADATAEPGAKEIKFPTGQSHILFGQPGIARSDADYFPLMVGNHALGGGGLTSVLMREVRQERGLSYGVSSRFVPLRANGPFLVSLQTANPQAEEALTVAQDTVATFREEGPDEDDLELARQNLAGGFPLRIDTNSKILSQLVNIAVHDLPLDHLDRYVASVEAVDRDQVRDAFQRHLDPERFATVVVTGE